MQNNLDISWVSLALTAALVIISLVVGYSQKLGMVKETLIAVGRAIVQLIIVGYILQFVFHTDQWILTFILYLIIIVNAAWATVKRSDISWQQIFPISFLAMFGSISITIIVLILSNAIKFTPAQVVPISGMLATNTMNAIGLVYRQMSQLFKERQEQVTEKLALGANTRQASSDIYRDSLKMGMQPQIDSAKTLGIVSLPGMMTGLMFAGVAPANAIKYQIMVTFMLVGATGIAALLATTLVQSKYFNKQQQLVARGQSDN